MHHASVLAISNYRLLRKLVVPMRGLKVITAANGSGKSSLYRALRLLADTAKGSLIPSLAREGGLQSTLRAGPESISRSVKQGDFPVQGTTRHRRVSLSPGFASDEFGYLIDLGLPTAGTKAFRLDPVVKQECVRHGALPRTARRDIAELCSTDGPGYRCDIGVMRLT
jgi:predicted ATPase